MNRRWKTAPGMLLLLAAWLPLSLHAQVTPDSSDINQQVIENNMEQTDVVNPDLETLTDQLENLRKHRVNLNRAGEDELQALVDAGLLTSLQKDQLQLYLHHFGKLISLYELQAVPDLDLPTIYALLPFVYVNTTLSDYQASFKTMLWKGDYTLLFRAQQTLQRSAGYFMPAYPTSGNHYLGSPTALYARFHYNFSNRLSYGITAQKDAGEEFFKGSQKQGFDFYSAHFFIRPNHVIKALALGDYEVHMGQGLLCRTGFGLGKSALVTQVQRSGYILQPYASVNEYSFFRGAAATAAVGRLSFTAFASYKAVDGNTVNTVDTVTENVTVSSIGVDGYHRTPGEVADKNVMHRSDAGATLQYHTSRFHLALNGLHTAFDAAFDKKLVPYNEFSFAGNKLSSGSADYHLQLGSAVLFGETAVSDNGGMATVNGLLMSLDPRLDLAMVYRNYSYRYESFYANSFGESTTPNNERGLYTGLSFRPVKGWQLDAYADYYRKPWLDYLVSAPSTGQDYLAQLTYTPNRNLQWYARFHHEIKQENFPGNSTPLDYLTQTTKDNFRINFSMKASSSLHFSSRVEVVRYQIAGGSTEHGYLAYADFDYKKMRWPVSFSVRYCLFQTDGYNSRIYTYENDMLYQFSTPALQDRGSRIYLLAHYRVSSAVDLWIRYAQTFYDNQQTISSGTDLINGPLKSELKAEMRLRF